MTLKFSTLLPRVDFISAIATDTSGDVYATGGGFVLGGGAAGGFALKIDPNAATISYFVPLDGIAGESIAVDDLGQVYIAGAASPGLRTVNALFPTTNAQTAAFVTKLSADGTTLFATYLGTGPSSSTSYATGIALGPAGGDLRGRQYLAGRPASTRWGSDHAPGPL